MYTSDYVYTQPLLSDEQSVALLCSRSLLLLVASGGITVQ
jgi:hypothetical protein